MTSLTWTQLPLATCYNAIRCDDLTYMDLVTSIRLDLLNVLMAPGKSDGSRARLVDQLKPVTFSDGDEYRINKLFAEIAVLLASEFDLDEVITAELLFHANNLSFQKGTNLADSARIAFYQRLLYILNILIFLVGLGQVLSVVTGEAEYELFFRNILGSFSRIYTLLSILNDLIDKQRVTSDINSLEFIKAIGHARAQLFEHHELLGQLLYSLIEAEPRKYADQAHFAEIADLLNKKVSDEDVFVLHFLPAIFSLVTQTLGSDAEADKLAFWGRIELLLWKLRYLEISEFTRFLCSFGNCSSFQEILWKPIPFDQHSVPAVAIHLLFLVLY